MKKVINAFSKNLKLALSLLFTVHCSLFTVNAQQTVQDTLLAIPNLTGGIDKIKPLQQPSFFSYISVNTQSSNIGDEQYFNCGETVHRTYFSFDTQNILSFKNQGYEIFVNSANIKFHASWGMGNGVQQTYPQFFGFDSLYCMADHIDIGTVLDTTDWTAGDVGDLQTLTSQIAIAIHPDSAATSGFREFPVTEFLQADIDSNRITSQYRLAFPGVESDGDCQTDVFSVLGTLISVPTARPQIVSEYTLFNYGDIDFDSFITELDAQIVLESIVSGSTLSDLNLKVGDVDGNGKLQVNDASLILKFVEGLITQFPVEI